MITSARAKLPEIGEGDEYVMAPQTGPPTYDVNQKEQRKIVSWRMACFEALGFGPTAAVALSLRRDIDRQVVEDMVGSGARLDQVVEILL